MFNFKLVHYSNRKIGLFISYVNVAFSRELEGEGVNDEQVKQSALKVIADQLYGLPTIEFNDNLQVAGAPALSDLEKAGLINVDVKVGRYRF